MNILDFIPQGREKAVTREYLCNATGFSDRDIREMISKARRNTPIINMQDGKGYFIPADKDIEYAKLALKQEESRAKSIFWSMHSLRQFVKKGSVNE